MSGCHCLCAAWHHECCNGLHEVTVAFDGKEVPFCSPCAWATATMRTYLSFVRAMRRLGAALTRGASGGSPHAW